MEENTILKICSIFGLMGLTVLGGYVPFMIKGFRGVKWTGISNSFAGGIFLGVGMLHLLPEAHEELEHTFPDIKLPFAFLLMLVGYTLILLLEKVV